MSVGVLSSSGGHNFFFNITGPCCNRCAYATFGELMVSSLLLTVKINIVHKYLQFSAAQGLQSRHRFMVCVFDLLCSLPELVFVGFQGSGDWT